MSFEKFDLENRDKERRKAIAKSIRIISIEELKKLGEEIFDEPDRPWRDTFLQLIAENPGAEFVRHTGKRVGTLQIHSTSTSS